MLKKSISPPLPIMSLALCVILFTYQLGWASLALNRSLQTPPYPPSATIEKVTWKLDTLVRYAPGSDLWPLTWAKDGHLYTSWGDGGGFGGTNEQGRVSLGVARIEGTPGHFVGHNIFGGKDSQVPATFIGKSGGILSVNGILYMTVCRQWKWDRAKICQSADQAQTWTCTDWDFEPPFNGMTFLTFGMDYQGSRDDFIYIYNDEPPHYIALARVPKNLIMDRHAYEFFAGSDHNRKPLWTSDINRHRSVFTDRNGTGWGPRVTYNPGLHRYLLTTHHDESGGWGIFDAPEPWGPWTTVAYYDRWIDSTFKFGFTFNQKWMSNDGKVVWMVFSGIGLYDSFNMVKATLTLRR